MKFAALLKKELRICLPWLLLCIVVFGLFGTLTIRGRMLNQKHYLDQGYQDVQPYYNYVLNTPIYETGPLILMVAMALGVLLAIVQFFLPELFRTWACPDRWVIIIGWSAAALSRSQRLGWRFSDNLNSL